MELLLGNDMLNVVEKKGSSEDGVRVREASISIFDVDLAYCYADALCEVDGLATIDGVEGLFVYEKLSSVRDEWHKPLTRMLLSPSFPSQLWSKDERGMVFDVCSVAIARNVVESNELRELIKRVYTYASEVANALIYASLILAPSVWKIIERDLIECCDCDESRPRLPTSLLIKSFSKVLAELQHGEHPSKVMLTDEVDKIVESKMEKLRDTLSRVSAALLFPQLGTKRYSAMGLARFVKALRRYVAKQLKEIAIVVSNEMKQRNEIEEIERALRQELEDQGIRFEEVPASRDAIRKYLERFINRDEHILVLVMQDYKKDLLVEPCRIEGLNATMVIVPESYYLTVRDFVPDSGSDTQRIVGTIAPFLDKRLADALDKEKFLRLLALKTVAVVCRDRS